MAALASVEYWCTDLRWCYLQQTVHFSSQIWMLSFPINWPSLVSTARSQVILWRDSDQINLRTNTIQIKYNSEAFVIWNHKSDQTRSMTYINKAWFDWCIDCYLIKTTSTSQFRSCVCGWMQFFTLVGFAGKLFLLPPPPPFLFFALVPTILMNSPGNACYAGYKFDLKESDKTLSQFTPANFTQIQFKR